MVAAKLAKLPANHRKFAVDQNTQSETAELLNVSERSVNTAKKVEREGVPDLSAAVTSGKVSVSLAAQAAELPRDEQQEILFG